MPIVFDTVEEFWRWKDVELASDKASDESIDRFKARLARFLRVSDKVAIELVPSARFGLKIILEKFLDKKRSVLVPRFNCNVIQESILAANGKVHLYDFYPSPGFFDWESIIQQISPDTGAIIVTHYFGVPIDFQPIIDFCRMNGILLIEDCAHTLGGKIGDQIAGTLGDITLLSFNYDKPISLGWGGAVVLNEPALIFDNFLEEIIFPSADQEIILLQNFRKALEVRRSAIPKQFNISEKIFRKLGMLQKSSFETSPNLGIGAIQAELGLWCLSQYESVLHTRVKHAEQIANIFPDHTWPVGAGVSPAWLKQKIRFSTISILENSARNLQMKGFRAGNFNWPNLLDGYGHSSPIYSLEAGELWMDVPIHQNLNEYYIERLSSYISSSIQ